MFRTILMILCLVAASDCMAQNNRNAPTPSVDTALDYKKPGAPMPHLRVARVIDSSRRNDSSGNAKQHLTRRQEREERKSDQKMITTEDDLDNGANLFVMMFNPTCSHCQDETDMIVKNMGLFNKSYFVFVSNPVMRPYIPDFEKQFHIRDYPNFRIGLDSSGFLGNVYRYGALPQINVYGSDRKLIKIFNGEVGIDSLKEYIQ